MIEEKWMKAALDEASNAGEDIPVGCVLVKDDQLITSAHNLKEKTNDPTAHAEILALRQAANITGSWRLTGFTLYTTLEPCPMCAEAILQARVSEVIFGAYDIKSGALGSVFNLYCEGRIYPLPQVWGGIMEDQCKKILLEFFRSRPKSRSSKHE